MPEPITAIRWRGGKAVVVKAIAPFRSSADGWFGKRYAPQSVADQSDPLLTPARKGSRCLCSPFLSRRLLARPNGVE